MYEKVTINFRPYRGGTTTRPSLTIEEPDNITSENGTVAVQKGEEVRVFPLDTIGEVQFTLKAPTD